MRGVITMNEEYETRFLCNSSKVRGWGRLPASPTLGPGRAEESWGRGHSGHRAPETGVPGFFASSRRVWCSRLKWLRLGIETVK